MNYSISQHLCIYSKDPIFAPPENNNKSMVYIKACNILHYPFSKQTSTHKTLHSTSFLINLQGVWNM